MSQAAVRLHLFVSPGAKRNALSRDADGALRARVAAPAAQGKANRALIELLAHELDVPRSRVRLVQGAGSRHKVVEIDGVPSDLIEGRLPAR